MIVNSFIHNRIIIKLYDVYIQEIKRWGREFQQQVDPIGEHKMENLELKNKINWENNTQI